MITVVGRARLRVTGGILSHAGLVRDTNEDAVSYVLDGERGALAIVADGMGGHSAGDVASRMAAETVERLYFELGGPPPAVLAEAFAAANRAIHEQSVRDPSCRGMGTTCTALVLRDGAAYLAHIGDSRAYMWRDGGLKQISEDHSLVAELVRDGVLTASQAANSPQRHVILRALGPDPIAQPEIWADGLPVQAGDLFVLCSDGLTDLVGEDAIADMVSRLPPREACAALVQSALAAGGTDNVSVGVFAIEAIAPQPDDTKPTRSVTLRGAMP